MKNVWRVIYSRAFIIVTLMVVTIALIFWGVTSATAYVPAMWTVLQFFSLLVAISIINRPMNTSFKLTWIVVVLGVPIFGALFYFILQSNMETYRYRKAFQKQAQLLRDYGRLSEQRLQQLSSEEKEDLKLVSYLSQSVGYPLQTCTDARYFSSGQEMFASLLEELKAAKHSIFMEYFIIDQGEMWDEILAILKAKALEGLDVRLMYDGMNSFRTLPYYYYKTLAAYGIQARVFSQIIPALSTIHNNRDHRKMTIIDGSLAFTGGVNLADEYINRKATLGYWKDAAMLVRGEVVSTLTLMFLQMWNYKEKDISQDFALLEMSEDSQQLPVQAEGYMQAYGESPFDQDEVAKRVYLDLIQSASQTIDIMTPYLIVDDEMKDNLIYAAKRGVRVRILLPHHYDKYSAYLVARTDFPLYLAAGIAIYEFSPGFVHSKVMLVDGKKATVGTVNLDFRSFYLNFECGLVIYNHVPVLNSIEEDFEQAIDQSQQLTLAVFEETYPWYKRLAGAFLRIIAPLL